MRGHHVARCDVLIDQKVMICVHYLDICIFDVLHLIHLNSLKMSLIMPFISLDVRWDHKGIAVWKDELLHFLFAHWCLNLLWRWCYKGSAILADIWPFTETLIVLGSGCTICLISVQNGQCHGLTLMGCLAWVLNGCVTWSLTNFSWRSRRLICSTLPLRISTLLDGRSIWCSFGSTRGSLLGSLIQSSWLWHEVGGLGHLVRTRDSSSSRIRLCPPVIEEANLIHLVRCRIQIASIRMLAQWHLRSLSPDALMSSSEFQVARPCIIVLRSHNAVISLCNSLVNVMEVLLLKLRIELARKRWIAIGSVAMIPLTECLPHIDHLSIESGGNLVVLGSQAGALNASRLATLLLVNVNIVFIDE